MILFIFELKALTEKEKEYQKQIQSLQTALRNAENQINLVGRSDNSFQNSFSFIGLSEFKNIVSLINCLKQKYEDLCQEKQNIPEYNQEELEKLKKISEWEIKVQDNANSNDNRDFSEDVVKGLQR